ncbi:MAG: hypothetical protein GX675_00955 [Erysipelotrichaceae bacterium]|nr:hypothetical protein [Erysipelotrichaceae bacterium]
MSTKKKIIAGKNIYKDNKNRDVLYVKSKKNGYIIQEKDQSSYTLYSNRFYISIIAGILAANFNIPLIYCIIASIILAVFLQYRYQTHFLPSLVVISNFKPANKVSTLDAMVAEKDKKRNLTLALLYVLFGVLIVINGIQMKVSYLILFGNILICIAAIYMGIMNFIAFTRIK